jgi:hypothetical protein
MRILEKLGLVEKKKSSNAWYIIGGTALALVVAGVAVNFPDIKRYIKMTTM